MAKPEGEKRMRLEAGSANVPRMPPSNTDVFSDNFHTHICWQSLHIPFTSITFCFTTPSGPVQLSTSVRVRVY